MKLFRADDDVTHQYRAMEQHFLTFAERLGVPAAALDAVMWRELRRTTGATHLRAEYESALATICISLM